MTDKVQTKVYLPPDVKALLDADERSNSDVVESALVAEYGGEKKAAIERRVEEKERRIATIESERNERQREIDELRDEIESLKQQQEHAEKAQQQIVEEAVQQLNIHPDEGHDNPAAEHWADKANMTPREFWQAYTDAYNE
jgi:chromosome segregation ATPase